MDDDDPYQVLGVTDGVSPADLKKAYYRKIREHPPESDSDGYQRVQRAYQAATDPEYPIRRRHGKEIDTLLEEVDALMEKGEHAAAVRPLKKVLVLHANSDTARFFLGICQTHISEWENAKRTFAKLVEQKPDSAQFRISFAWVFINQANSMESNPEAEARLAGEARAQLDEARKLEPDNPAMMRAYAKSYGAQSDWPKAIDWAEKAAATRVPLDIDDYTYLVQLQAFSKRIPAVTVVADRLAERLTDEGVKVAGLHFAKEAVEFQKQHMFFFAHAFILAADRLHPDDPNISAVCDQWVNAEAASDEYDRMTDDKEMNPAVRALCALFSNESRNVKFPEPPEKEFDRIKKAINTWEPHEIAASARRVQRKYQAVYRLNPDTFDEMAGEKAPKSARRYPSRSRRPAPSPAAPSPATPPPAPPSVPPPPPVRARPVEPPPPRAIPVAEPVSRQSDYRQPSRSASEMTPHRGGTILLLGILSLLCCIPCGLFAIGMGGSDLAKMERGEMNPKGRGLTITGMVLGVIGLLIGFINIIRILNAK